MQYFENAFWPGELMVIFNGEGKIQLKIHFFFFSENRINHLFSCRKQNKQATKPQVLDLSHCLSIVYFFPPHKTLTCMCTHGQEGSILTNKISANSKFILTLLMRSCLSSSKAVITFFIIKLCPCCQLPSLSALKFREQRTSQLILSETLSEIIQISHNLFELCLEQVTEFQIQ